MAGLLEPCGRLCPQTIHDERVMRALGKEDVRVLDLDASVSKTPAMVLQDCVTLTMGNVLIEHHGARANGFLQAGTRRARARAHARARARDTHATRARREADQGEESESEGERPCARRWAGGASCARASTTP